MFFSSKSLLVALAILEFTAALPPPYGESYPRDAGGNVKRASGINVQLGPRPFYLVNNMDSGSLKDKLESCTEGPFSTSKFSISHRGAPLMFPEHSREGYMAAARMGAGIIECDVSFTSDRELVCRHSNCDLHYTTNILATPLADKCTQPFTPYDPSTGTEANATCCTSDITLAEFKSLCAEMEGTTFNARNTSEYMGRIGSTPDWRTNMYAYSCATTMSLEEQITLVDSMGLDFTAEAKTPEVPMPFQGNYTQHDFIQQIVDTFKNMNIEASRVWLQSFLVGRRIQIFPIKIESFTDIWKPADIYYWLENDPDFGAQAIYLDERGDDSPSGYETAVKSLDNIAARGVKIVAPDIWQLVTLDNATGEIVPSSYAKRAKEVGLDIITWSFERSGPLEVDGGGSYYHGLHKVINNDGDEYSVIDVIADPNKVGALKIFADWCATITYYANCMGLS